MQMEQQNQLMEQMQRTRAEEVQGGEGEVDEAEGREAKVTYTFGLFQLKFT